MSKIDDAYHLEEFTLCYYFSAYTGNNILCVYYYFLKWWSSIFLRSLKPHIPLQCLLCNDQDDKYNYINDAIVFPLDVLSVHPLWVGNIELFNVKIRFLRARFLFKEFFYTWINLRMLIVLTHGIMLCFKLSSLVCLPQ